MGPYKPILPGRTMDIDLGIDGYPLDPASPESFHQRELNAWLARGNPNAMPPAIDWHQSEQITLWLTAVVHRHQWINRNAELLPLAEPWRSMLTHLMRLALNRLAMSHAVVPEDTLIELAGIDGHWISDYLNLLLAAPWTQPLRAAIHLFLLQIDPDEGYSTPLRSQVAWSLFLDPEDPDDGDPCWSAAVRRDLRQFPRTTRDTWIRFFRSTPKRRAKALAAIGEPQFTVQANRWLDRFREPHPVTMEHAGQHLLRILLESLPTASPWPAATQWASERSLKFWLRLVPNYVTSLVANAGTRDALQVLASQPYAARVPEISRAVASLKASGTDSINTRIDVLLTSMWESRKGIPMFDYPSAIAQLQPDGGLETEIERTLRERIALLAKTMPKQDDPAWVRHYSCHNYLTQFHSALLCAGAPLNEEALAAAVRQGNFASFERAAEYTRLNGYKPVIVEAVREFHQTLHGTTVDMNMRKHVGWWLWLDDSTPIDHAECWTSVIRAGLRAMPFKTRKAWLAVIENITFNMGGRMPAKWVKVAEKALQGLGPEEFYNRIEQWFTSFNTDKPLNVSTPGSDLLRCLIWDYSLLPPNPKTDEAFVLLSKATYKNKQARDRMLKIVPVMHALFAERSPELAWEALDGLVRNLSIRAESPDYILYTRLAERLHKQPHAATGKPLPAPPNPNDPVAMLRMMCKHYPAADRISIAADHVLVKGDLDEYSVHFDGRITRRSGQPVRIDFEELPAPAMSMWQNAIDAEDLRKGMFGVNLSRILFAIGILTADTQYVEALH